MAYIRSKKVKGNTYYYLVKSVRENGRVRQVTVKYLGAEDPRKGKPKTVRQP